MKRTLFYLFAIVLVSSCASDPEDVIDPDADPNSETLDGFVDVTTDFSETRFVDPLHLTLLKELDIGVMTDQDSTVFASYSPENFRILPFKDGAKLKNAFILQMKAGIVLKGQSLPLKERNIVVFEREAGKLVKVNGYRGDMTALRPGKNGAKDLIITFYSDLDETFFDCVFNWNGKSYDFIAVEAINWGEGFQPVKVSLKDSISKDVYTQLMQTSLIF
ncbi:MAG: hypothetical protein ACI837_002634 [Crocinitomicaceae bacterium]|jgi:hypothetical protein